MRWWILVLCALCSACDDGDEPPEVGPPPTPDMALPPPPPPSLTGLFRVRQQRLGGDCPADLAFPAVHTLYATSTDTTIEWAGMRGDRQGAGFEAQGASGLDACGQPIGQVWQMQVSANGAAFAGQASWTYAACNDRPACAIAVESRAERIGGHRAVASSTVELDPSDRAVLSSAVFDDAAWMGTASASGARIWRLTTDGGVPFLAPAISDGFRSVDPALGGNNIGVSAMARVDDRLLVGTWDAPAAVAEPLGLPAGDGFDLWAFQADAWTPLTTDGFGDPARARVEAIAVLDGAPYLAVTHADAGPQVLDAAGALISPADGFECGRAASDLIVHAGALHLAYSGCPDGVRVLRFDGDGWTPLGTGLGAGTAALISDGAVLFALTRGPVALHRHVAQAQWVTVATDGLADATARSIGRGLRVHDSDLLVLPVGDTAWVTKGGAPVRDLTRFATAEAPIGHALSFERRLFLSTGVEPIDWDGPPSVLLRSDTLLTEMGPTTLRTQRDRVLDTARGADAACPRTTHWFNPAIQHDQRVQVELPLGVVADDIVRLPAVYVLHDQDAPDFAAQAQAMRAMASCLYGRRATIPCGDESNHDCVLRCLTERLDLERLEIDPTPILTALGADAMVELPIIERVAFVFAGYGAGVYVDAPDAAPWTPPDGRQGAWSAAIPALAEYVERCWELSIRGPEARFGYGFGVGGLAVAARVGSVFTAGVAHAPRFNTAALDPGWQAQPPWSPSGPLAFVLDAQASTCAAQEAVCESATTCADWISADQPGQVIVAGSDASLEARLPAIALALRWLTRRDAPSDAPDCAAIPACAPSACE